MSARAALRLAAVPLTAVTAAAAVLKAGHWRVSADRHGIRVTAVPRPRCPRCHGDSGWWVGGAHPEMEACGCWAERPELRVRLLSHRDPWPDEPPVLTTPSRYHRTIHTGAGDRHTRSVVSTP